MVDYAQRSEAAPGCGAQGPRERYGIGAVRDVQVTERCPVRRAELALQPEPPAADTAAMTAATKLAPASTHDTPPEPAWGHEELEALSEDEVVGLLLRRMRKLSARGWDPGEALIVASRLHLAIR
jgi:hypothetical protein